MPVYALHTFTQLQAGQLTLSAIINTIARPHQARAAGSPPLASRPTACPVQVVPTHVQGAGWSGTDIHRQPVTSVSSRQRLRSATRGDLVVSSSDTHFGVRAFAVAGPKAWNQLPAHLRALERVGPFKTAL